MNATEVQRIGFRRSFSCAAIVAVLYASYFMTGTAQAQDAYSWPHPSKMRDQKIEMATKIKQPFNLVAVGDMLQMVPFSKNSDPDVQFLMNLMRGADITVANNENTIVNFTTFTGPGSQNEAPASVADLRECLPIPMPRPVLVCLSADPNPIRRDSWCRVRRHGSFLARWRNFLLPNPDRLDYRP